VEGIHLGVVVVVGKSHSWVGEIHLVGEVGEGKIHSWVEGIHLVVEVVVHLVACL